MTAQNLNIKEFLDQDQKKDLLRLLTAGSVDDGKSTLIGRLMFDSKMLYEDQLSALERDSKRLGHAGESIDYALLLDGLKAEREQGITIDVAYRYFSTSKRKFIIADTPGHEQYTRNMITGGSTANLAIILVDATKGVITQTRRHTFLVSLLGIKHILLAVNKMDLAGYSHEVFDDICSEYKSFVTQLDIPDLNFIPLSALKGDNIVELSGNTPWYHGQSMLEFLENVHVSSDRNYEDFRFPVQYVIRPDLNFRGFAGNIASGMVRPGDEIIALPSRKVSKVKKIVTYNSCLDRAFPPQAVTIELEDEIDISRGEMLVHPDNMPRIDRHFEAMLVWMDEEPMDSSTHFFLKHTTNTVRAHINILNYKIDVNTLQRINVGKLNLNEIGRALITTAKPLFFDPYKKNRNTGSFVLIHPVTNNTVAVGMILDKLDSKNLPSKITDLEKETIRKGKSLIPPDSREKKLNQKGVTLWFTGLHGSGKNELAFSLEKKLFDNNAVVVLLDGSSVRSGLNRELDYSPADRAENLRRVGHIAKILNDHGIIAICSFISRNNYVRNQVADIIGKERFHLFYMNASLEYCRKNKPELYEKADKGEIDNLPGVDLEYDEPADASLVFNPAENELNIDRILDYLEKKKIFPLK
jgi:bifunctional enzyme CysN/CysC